MDLAVLSPQELPIALGALKTVALADGDLVPAEIAVLGAIAAIHGASIDPGDVVAASPAEAARAIEDPHRRKRLVQLSFVMALADGELAKAEERACRELAAALDVPERGLDVLHDVAHGHRLLARVDMGRRGVKGLVGPMWDRDGFRALRELVAPLLGAEAPELAWKYKELGLLPEGTFGREIWAHMTKRHFAFPGEKGGLPERMAFHDIGHVLAGYDTDPEGEIQQGAFQAGFIREDGFVFLLFVMLQFHMGLQLTPIAEPQRGLFDADKVLRAVARGAACRVDLSRDWQPWEHVHRPIDDVRADLGIPPLTAQPA